MDGLGRLHVAVIFGGRSSEHSVSCMSAGSVLAAIDRSLYVPVPVGITREGRWVMAPDEPGRLQIRDGVLPEVDPHGQPVLLPGDPVALGRLEGPGAVGIASGASGDGGLAATGERGARLLGDIDVVLPMLHGPFGEDGTIQGLLEMAGLPYVGSGVFASAAAMDKGHMKAALQAGGLEVGPYVLITAQQWRSDPAGALARVAGLGFPVFVKPARAGSSVGISRVNDPDALEAAIVAARVHDPRVIVEAGFAGVREIECGVLDTESGPEASACAEIVVGSGHDFYDFEAKYLEDSVDLIVPAVLPGEVLAEVHRQAVAAFQALTCEGLARVDFFITAEGRAIVNEVNTMPGFTPISMFPRMWQASGLEYPALVDHLLQDALRRGTGLR